MKSDSTNVVLKSSADDNSVSSTSSVSNSATGEDSNINTVSGSNSNSQQSSSIGAGLPTTQVNAGLALIVPQPAHQASSIILTRAVSWRLIDVDFD